ncbi:hypothetical protein EDB86DRAFT_2832211 [Lactarius hatsudake]|nr:hypothetical protein EDB86DRAFT_2832211 [Lactarius hatsudake]
MSAWRGGRRGLARRVEAVWRVGGVLACRVGSACRESADGRVHACQGGVGVRGGGALPAMLGWRGGGLAVEVLRVVLGRRGLARRVGAAKWVGGGGVSGQDGGGSCARMACNVLRAVLGWRGGLAVAAYWGRDE